MIAQEIRKEIIDLIHREVVPAMGCTEPIAVALAVAKATELLGCQPARIAVALSGNVLKNAMGVGIPGTGMIGLPIAIALGAIIGRSEYSLEVLRDVNDEAVAQGRRYIDEGRIGVSHDPGAPSKLHIAVTVTAPDNSTARATISGSHTNFVFLAKDDNILLDKPAGDDEHDTGHDDLALCLSTVWEFAMETPLDEIRFILEARTLNKAAADKSFHGSFGHSVGSTLINKGIPLLGDTPLLHMIADTAGACDVRMAGDPMTVMSNSGSGNQGITTTMPVVSYAEAIGADEEHLIRALTLSHLTSIYIKQSLGRLSALCGCVVASTGAAAALVYLMGGDYTRCCFAIKNMVANLTGMVCDGAKPACAIKVTTGVSSAVISALLAMNDQCVTSSEGIVDDDIDRTIHNLTSIGRDAMTETDHLVLDIMTR